MTTRVGASDEGLLSVEGSIAMRTVTLAFCAALAWSVAACPAFAIDIPIERLTDSPNLSGPGVRAIAVSPDGASVAYLKGGDDDRQRQDLWVFDSASGRARRLIDARQLPGERALSADEAARRERQRTAGSRGVGQFQWFPDGKRLLFDVGDTLWSVRPDGNAEPTPTPLVTGDDIIDPRLSPKGHYLAYVRAQDLFVLDIARGQATQLTHDGGGTIHNAEAEFVAQEEMDQDRGYWWSPDESTIVFKRFDESTIPVVRRFEIEADTTKVVEQHYPFTGGPNVGVRLGVVDVAAGTTRWIPLGEDQPYIPRVAWLPDGESFSYQHLSRDQKALTLVRVDLKDLTQTVLLTDHSSTWIDLHDDLRFLERQSAFIWASEREGRKHLELIGLDGRRRHAITAGDWQVDGLLAVDEAAGYVYVSGDRATALEQHVWRVRLDGRDADRPVRISDGAGVHVAWFPESHGALRLWVDSYNDPSTPPQVSVRDVQGRRLAWIEENRLDATHPYFPYLDRHVVPEFSTLPADDGTPLNYAILRPPGFDPTRRYPVFLNVYGGPGVQNVQRRWGRPFLQAVARRGYMVCTLDNRGSSRRGRRFSDAIYRRLGDVEVRDQLAGLDWLDRQPGVDRDHVGVFGWSYGGYMTLMLLAKAPPGRFAGGVAVAPVAREELYDTAYTERYLGTPAENPYGYRDSSVFSVLSRLDAPLLLVHGMADDNVLFTNSTALMAALQAQGKRFRLMTYPGGKHGLSERWMTDHVQNLIVDYFDEVVRGQGPKR